MWINPELTDERQPITHSIERLESGIISLTGCSCTQHILSRTCSVITSSLWVTVRSDLTVTRLLCLL